MYTRALLKNKIRFNNALVLCCVVGTFSCEIGFGASVDEVLCWKMYWWFDEVGVIESDECEENLCEWFCKKYVWAFMKIYLCSFHFRTRLEHRKIGHWTLGIGKFKNNIFPHKIRKNSNKSLLSRMKSMWNPLQKKVFSNFIKKFFIAHDYDHKRKIKFPKQSTLKSSFTIFSFKYRSLSV